MSRYECCRSLFLSSLLLSQAWLKVRRWLVFSWNVYSSLQVQGCSSRFWRQQEEEGAEQETCQRGSRVPRTGRVWAGLMSHPQCSDSAGIPTSRTPCVGPCTHEALMCEPGPRLISGAGNGGDFYIQEIGFFWRKGDDQVDSIRVRGSVARRQARTPGA